MNKLTITVGIVALGLTTTTALAVSSDNSKDMNTTTVSSSNFTNSNVGKTGFYVQTNAGINYLQATHPTAGAKIKYDWGWNGGVATGYQHQNYRGELAVNYLDNGMNEMTIDHASNIDLSSDKTTAITYMINGYYNIDLGSQFVPYIGVGGGIASVKTKLQAINSIGLQKSDSKDNVLAYQGILGVAYQENARLRFFIQYKHIATASYKITETSNNDSVEGYYQNNLAQIGVGYNF